MKIVGALAAFFLAVCAATTSHAQSQGRAGDFDYYVLALSWSPTFCADEANPDSRRQCRLDRRFIVHGLWPQYERGWPERCPSSYPSRLPSVLLDRYGDITPDRGLLAHQWRKHGTCSGLDPQSYFEAARAMRSQIDVPEKLASIRQQFSVTRDDLRAMMVAANPTLPRDAIAITCDNRRLDEVRICFSRDGMPRKCGADVLQRMCGRSPMIVLRP
ncbi:MAG: ribonuclease [Pseudomonadota bacterium]